MYKEKQLLYKIYINSKAFNINVNKISSENLRFLKIMVNCSKKQLTTHGIAIFLCIPPSAIMSFEFHH